MRQNRFSNGLGQQNKIGDGSGIKAKQCSWMINVETGESRQAF